MKIWIFQIKFPIACSSQLPDFSQKSSPFGFHPPPTRCCFLGRSQDLSVTAFHQEAKENSTCDSFTHSWSQSGQEEPINSTVHYSVYFTGPVGRIWFLYHWNERKEVGKTLDWEILPNSNIQILYVSMLSRFSQVRLFATPWTVARQAPLSMEILQARILEWVAMPSSRGSPQPRDWTGSSYFSCMGRWVLYHQRHLGIPTTIIY